MDNNIIDIKNINKYYNTLQVLNDVSLKIQKTNVVVVCGPSGCGKSTLLRCLNGLENVSSGDIIINGKSILEKKNLRAIFIQNSQLLLQYQY